MIRLQKTLLNFVNVLFSNIENFLAKLANRCTICKRRFQVPKRIPGTPKHYAIKRQLNVEPKIINIDPGPTLQVSPFENPELQNIYNIIEKIRKKLTESNLLSENNSTKNSGSPSNTTHTHTHISGCITFQSCCIPKHFTHTRTHTNIYALTSNCELKLCSQRVDYTLRRPSVIVIPRTHKTYFQQQKCV